MNRLFSSRWESSPGSFKPFRREFFLASMSWLAASLIGCDGAGRATSLAPGALLPKVDLPGLDGVLQPIPGPSAPLLINFWATWCSPCRAEMASLNRLYLAARAQGLRFYGVSVDEDINLVREFVLQSRLDFPILMDLGGKAARDLFRIAAFPTTLLVRPDGRLDSLVEGAREWDSGNSAKAVMSLLSQQ